MSKAFAVSWDGRLVVGASQSPTGAMHACAWTPETGIQDLNHLFRYVIPPGWELAEAWDISPDGRYIAGWGLNPNDKVEAWLLDTAGAPWSRRLPGDANGDCQVDDADLLIVLFAFGSNDPGADLNGNGVVDDADLLIVLFNFGSGC